MQHYKLMTIIFILLLLSIETLISGQEKKPTIAIGYAAIINNDIIRARQVAILDAKRSALEKEVGVIISSETITKNFQLIKDEIYARSEGYVKEAKVLEEEKINDIYRVKIKCIVLTKELRNDLQEILFAKRYPRMMIVIKEIKLNRITTMPTTEVVLINEFLKKGFRCVDQTQVEKIRATDQLKQALAGNKRAAILIGRRNDAEVIIVGEAEAKFAMEIGGLKSSRATINVRAINTDVGSIIATANETASGVDITEEASSTKALENAAEKLSKVLINKIIEKWTEELTKYETIQILVKVKDYEQLKQFSELLKNILGVKEVINREFIKNVATLDVKVKFINTPELADKLSNTKLNSSTVKVTSFSANRIDIAIVNKK